MVERRVCTFCGNEIEPGTGMMYVKTDGTILRFCRSKCRKNLLELKRTPRRTQWTQQYAAEKTGAKAPPKVRRAARPKKAERKTPVKRKAPEEKPGRGGQSTEEG